MQENIIHKHISKTFCVLINNNFFFLLKNQPKQAVGNKLKFLENTDDI